MIKRYVWILIFFTTIFCHIYGEKSRDNDWKILSQAWIAFESGDPGAALQLCEQARDAHVNKNSYQLQELKRGFFPVEVRKAGDDLEAIYKILQKRTDYTALSVLDEIYLRYPPEYFSKSVKKLINWLESRAVFPEADYLTGRIYEAEGEIRLALQYYQKALEHHAMLDVPDDRFVILYRMADLARLSGDYKTMETILLRIVSEDSLFTQNIASNPRLAALLRTLRTEPDTTKFFMLYRHDYFQGLKAYSLLAQYYLDSGYAFDSALSVSSISVLIAVTRLSSACKDYDFDWEYTTLSDLFKTAGLYPEITTWARDEAVWESFLIFSEILARSGYISQSEDVLHTISAYVPEPSVAGTARALLVKNETK